MPAAKLIPHWLDTERWPGLLLHRVLSWSRAAAGLALAPSSVNPSVNSLWITERGVDNDSNSNENDGKIYEMSLPGATPGNTPPSVTITSPPDGTNVPVGASIDFAGTAMDNEDGNLTAGLGWSSDLDGTIGSGAGFTTSGLSEGAHVITLLAGPAWAIGEVFQLQVTGTEYCGDFDSLKLNKKTALPLWLRIESDTEFTVSTTPNFDAGTTFPLFGFFYLSKKGADLIGGAVFPNGAFATVQASARFDKKTGLVRSLRGTFVQSEVFVAGCFSSGRVRTIKPRR